LQERAKGFANIERVIISGANWQFLQSGVGAEGVLALFAEIVAKRHRWDVESRDCLIIMVISILTMTLMGGVWGGGEFVVPDVSACQSESYILRGSRLLGFWGAGAENPRHFNGGMNRALLSISR
jgi:hypothetical protein